MKNKMKKILSICFAILFIVSTVLTTAVSAFATEVSGTETSDTITTDGADADSSDAATAETTDADSSDTATTEPSDSEDPVKYSVYFKETEGGTVGIKDDGVTEYEAGDKVYLSIVPDENYMVTSVDIVDENGTYLSWLDADDNPCDYVNISEVISFEMPESLVTVSVTFWDGESEIELDDTELSANSVFRLMGLGEPDAIAMASAEDNIMLASVSSGNSITIRRAVAEDMNGAFNTYVKGTYDTTESVLLSTDGDWVFCAQPRTAIGKLNPAVTFSYWGNAVDKMNSLYSWDASKTNRVSMGMRVASGYFKHWGCNYCLMQNVLWSQISGKDSSGTDQSGVYTLTNGKYSCSDLDTKDKLDAALSAVWAKVDNYRKMPTYNNQIQQATAGSDFKIWDYNYVSNDLNIWNASGVDYSVDSSGITIKNTSSLAGKTVTFWYEKKNNLGLDFSAKTFFYEKDSRQKASVWDSAISKFYGCVSVHFADTEDSYMTAHYKANDKLAPALDLYIAKSDADTNQVLAGAEFQVYMDDKLVSTVTTDANGQAVYHWRGDVIYTQTYESSKKLSSFGQWKSKYAEAKNEVKTKVANELNQIKAQTHKWKVIETKAPTDYELNTIVWEQEIPLSTTAVEVSFTDVSQGFLNMNKVSADETLVKDNPCYSLEGAVYGVYKTKDDAINDTNKVETLTTDKDGNSNTVKLNRGKYFVKELTASKGYELCKEKDNDDKIEGIHQVVIKAKETTSFTCKEVPGNDPFALTLQKMDEETGEAVAPGDTSLNGAIFELAYYTNTDGDTSGTPFKTWYFETKSENGKDGKINCNNPYFLLKSHTMENGTTYTSDELFTNSDGEVQYPVGTYTFKEVSAPLYFQKVGYMNFREYTNGKVDVNTGLKVIIKQNANGEAAKIYDGNNVISGNISAENLSVNAYDEKQPGSITLYKKTSDGTKKPLAGVTFKMVGLTTNDEYEATTDEDGKITWGDLVAQKYVITEVKTVDGMNLLKDNITVTMPMEMTLDEIKANNADINQSIFDEVSGKYCFYDLTFTIDNSITFDMPITGGNQTVMYIVLIAGLAAVAGGIWFMMRKKK